MKQDFSLHPRRTVNVPKKTHHALKICAAKNKTSIYQEADYAIQEYVRKELGEDLWRETA